MLNLSTTLSCQNISNSSPLRLLLPLLRQQDRVHRMEGGSFVHHDQAPVASLPVELLTNIFAIIAQDPQYENFDEYLPDISLAISHVCAFWRKVALGPGCRSLWTHAPLRHNPACVRVFMERSKPQVVFAKIELSDRIVSSSADAVAEAVAYIDRLDRLSFYSLYDDSDRPNELDSNIHQTLYHHLISRAAPALKAVVWSYTHAQSPQDDAFLPPDLFAGEIPSNLRHLQLNGAYVVGFPLLRANLTYLEIEESTAWNEMDDVLDSLSCMSGLEQIILNSWQLMWDVGETTYAQRSICLPHLNTFSISTVQTGFASLFCYLQVPRAARIHLGLDLSGDDNLVSGDILMLYDALEAHYGADAAYIGDACASSAISVGQCGYHSRDISLQFFEKNVKCLSITLTAYSPQEGFSLSTRATIMAAIRMLLGISIIPGAARLNISHSTFFARGHSEDWRTISTCMPNLETIVLSRATLQGLCPALLARSDSESGVGFPRLNRLYLEGIAFDDETNQAAFFIVVLTRLVTHRLRVGYPIKVVEFRKCFGAKELAQHLATILFPLAVEVRYKMGARSAVSAENEAARWDDFE